MNQLLRKFVLGCLPFFMVGAFISAQGQSVFNPNDPIVIYNAANPPTQPVFGQPGKWVKTNRLSWNTSSYKAYIYKGIQFRLKFPKNYDGSGATKYPLFLFFHGRGEVGSIYDNEYQMYHGGELHRNAVDNNQFNGFLLYPQTPDPDGIWSGDQRRFLAELIENFLVPEVNVDIFRVIVDGLSGGGLASWNFFKGYPRLVAAVLPISNAASTTSDYIIQNKFTPIWLFQGALDQSPVPAIAQYLNTKATQAGANFRYTEYPNLGHGCWYAAWGEPDYFPFLTRAHKANPWPIFGRVEFCPNETINTTIGVSAGFNEYQWMRNGIVLTGAGVNSNTLTVTALGTYSCRVRLGTVWSPWSPIPVEIKTKTTTIPPVIKVSGLASRVLPSPDGKNTVDLEVPSGYSSYNWQKILATTTPTVSITNVLNGAAVGNYRVQVTEQFGCSSAFTSPFAVINANGPNKPDAATNLIAIPLSYTSLRLNWSSNPNPVYPQTNFEIYEATQAGGPYHFVSLVDANVYNFIREGLTPGVKYYYIIRAINNTAGSNISNEASASTQKDNEAPTAPGNLTITGTTRSSVSLEWNESSDNVGLANYEVYVNGTKSYVSTGTEFTVYNLIYGNTYNFVIKAVDIAGNKSAPSNQVTTQTLAKGLTFKHYIGTWDNLPNFSILTPILTGTVPNVTLSNATQSENYAFLWEGYIRIPSDGNYIFQTRSDDGSKLYLAPYNNATTALVNNDYLQGPTSRNSATTFLTAGVYPIAITYFQKGGGAEMGISWQRQGTGGWSMTPIPDIAFVDPPFPPAGSAPAAPSNLTASAISYKQINLSWTDNSNNEQSFEIFRSTDPMDNFTTVGVLPANTLTFKDTLVAPATQYFYKIRAINQYGESAFDKTGPGVDYAYYEQTGMTVIPNFANLTPVKKGKVATFGLGMQLRGDNFAVKFDGLITITNPGTYTFFLSSDDGSRLYIDDILRVDHDGLHGNTEKAGTAFNLTAGVHTIRVTFFEAGGGETLVARYQGPGIPKQTIPGNVLGDILANATTLAAPPIPAAPTDLTAVGISSTAIKVGWVNHSVNATGNELYRSYNDNSDYVFLATVPANATSYNDTALYPSSLFFYRIKAVSEGGSSEYSNEKSARTLGVVPSILPIENVYMRYGTQVKLNIEAVSGTPIDIALQVSNLPSFASFQQTANGKGMITFNPAESDQGVYNNIVVTAANPQNDLNTAKFNLVVNSNYVPDIANISNVSVNEKQTIQLNLSATDQDADDYLIWTFTGLPSFATVTATNNRTAALTFAPGYGNAGVYKVTANVKDGKNGKDTSSFNVTVVHVNVPNPNDGTAPLKPSNVAVSFDNGANSVHVTWTNVAYNATRNEIYRSTSLTGYYTLLNPNDNNKDSTSYYDQTATGNKTYFYSVRAVNDNGGTNSAIIKIITPNRAPIISGGDIYVRSSNILDATITATDDPGDVISLSISNLPTFASFTDNGNGSGVLHLVPTGVHVGNHAITLKATDSYGAISLKSIKIVVTDQFLTSVYVNFNNINYPVNTSPWNNFNATLQSNGIMPSGRTLSNLKDETGIATGINMLLPESWPQNTLGVVTGDNSGVFQDDVIQTGYYFSVSASQPSKSINITGLSTTKKYNLIFYGNRSFTTAQITDFTVGSQTVSLDSRNNTTNTVQINALSPNAQGQITVTVKAATGKYAVINALVIQSYDNGTVLPPFSLKMFGSTKNSVSLSWKSNASNVSAFEVWRSDAPGGTYIKLSDNIPGNVFTYTDNGLANATVYYYKVRAVSGTNFSIFSDYISAGTVSYAIDINFNDGYAGPAQPAPWNNVNELITNGFTMTNLVNQNNQNTGIGMTVLSNFGGFNINGPTTGNNSGPVPDNVMKSYYFLEYGVVPRLRITGLNQSMRYNFIFFGSRLDNGIGQTTAYTIGNETVLLNCKNNTTNTVQINNVAPDAMGNVDIVLASAIPGGNGYLNALTIQASPTPASSGSGSSGRKSNTSGNLQNAGNGLDVDGDLDSNTKESGITANAYPNPFIGDIMLRLTLKKAKPKLTVLLKDFSGKPLYSEALMNVPAGKSQHRLNVNGRALSPGIYSIQVLSLSDGEAETIKIIKH